jgi:hypothetical protein
MTTQVNAFIKKGYIQECNRTDLDVVSPFFLQEKANGKGWRLLLNLEGPNAFGTPDRFDMQGIREAMKLMQRGCYFYTADIADAFYSIGLHTEDQRLFGTSHTDVGGKRKYYRFIVAAQGATDSPAAFDTVASSFTQQAKRQARC